MEINMLEVIHDLNNAFGFSAICRIPHINYDLI